MKKNIKIKVEDKIILKILSVDDVSENYVSWLNDYEVIKFTEQKYFKHTLKSVTDFVRQKYYSKINFLFGIFIENIHIMRCIVIV